MSEWISVKEKLPPHGQLVIVHGGVAHIREDKWYTITGFPWPGNPIQWKVTHWMPLPDPPKESTDAD